MGKSRIAQISMEYMLIVGLSFLVLVPTAYFFYSYSRTSSDDTVRQQINQIGYEMLKNSESIYGLAEGSLMTIDVKYPKNIRDIFILNGNELVIRYEINSGMNDAVFFSKIPLSGIYDKNRILPTCGPLPCTDSTFHPKPPLGGKHSIKFESKGNYVLLTLLT